MKSSTKLPALHTLSGIYAGDNLAKPRSQVCQQQKGGLGHILRQ